MRNESNKSIENRGDEDQLRAKRDDAARTAGSPGNAPPNAAKVGSDPAAARAVGGPDDFGYPEKAAEKAANPRTRDDEYAGRPKGSAPGQTGEASAREHGVGAPGGRRGKGSGGDTDPDLVGFGTPGGGSVTGDVNEPPGPDDADKSPSAPHGRNPVPSPNVGGPVAIPGGSVNDRNPGDLSTTGGGGATSNVANADREVDDAFAGEVTNGEARGADNSPQDNNRS